MLVSPHLCWLMVSHHPHKKAAEGVTKMTVEWLAERDFIDFTPSKRTLSVIHLRRLAREGQKPPKPMLRRNRASDYSRLPHFQVQFLRTEHLSDAKRKVRRRPPSSLPQEVGCVESILQSIGLSIPLGFGKVTDKATSGMTGREKSFNPAGGEEAARLMTAYAEGLSSR